MVDTLKRLRAQLVEKDAIIRKQRDDLTQCKRLLKDERRKRRELEVLIASNARRERLHLMTVGTQVIKFHYSKWNTHGTRMLRLSSDMKRIVWWLPPRSQLTRSIALDEVLGILYGYKSKTLLHHHISRGRVEIPGVREWFCFSLVTSDRTVDFAVPDDEELVIAWILGIQECCLKPIMRWTRGGLVSRRGWMKVRHMLHEARKVGFSRSSAIAQSIRSAAAIVDGERARQCRSVLARVKNNANDVVEAEVTTPYSTPKQLTSRVLNLVSPARSDYSIASQSANDLSALARSPSRDEIPHRYVRMSTTTRNRVIENAPLAEVLSRFRFADALSVLDSFTSTVERFAKHNINVDSSLPAVEALSQCSNQYASLRYKARQALDRMAGPVSEMKMLISQLSFEYPSLVGGANATTTKSESDDAMEITAPIIVDDGDDDGPILLSTESAILNAGIEVVEEEEDDNHV